MKRIEINQLKKKGINLSISFAIVIALFLVLPLMYIFSLAQVRKIFLDRNSIKKIRTVHLVKKKKKKRKKKELKKIKKNRLDKMKNKAKNRFKLDLSLAMNCGFGTQIQVDKGLKIYREGQVDIPPIRKIFFMPEYPIQAKIEGVQTVVDAELLIDEYGLVKKVMIIKCIQNWGFEKSVRNALMKWRFEPAKIKNMPVKIWAKISIDFKL